ncbi:unannotated protein [freshwater metagenome]|uniref:Unannotated protein n=1 Tax=freshwater metagenome TaxID=449393 RepID=A0A6J6GR87_9ZZZZ|nr:hypothetical protein [Actinomycetota bacterium]
MLQSRMFTTAFRFFAGMAIFALLAAFVLGVTSQSGGLMDRVIGPLTLGWKGGIGNHFGYTFFVSLFAVAAGLAGVLVAFRDADPEAEAQVVHTESVPLTRAPSGSNYLPSLAAFSAILMMIGMGTRSSGLTLGALAVIIATAFIWTLRTWAERATGDDTVNAELYHRFVDPLRTPVVAIVSIAVVAIGLSRVLLAVSKTGSVIVFGVASLLFFGVATLLALRPKSGRSVATVLVVIGAIAVIAAGIAGAVAGEREIEHHDPAHEGASVSTAVPGIADRT